MSNLKDALHIPDTQSERDERHLAIQRVGVKSVRYPLQLRIGDVVSSTVAMWALDVALPAEQKGTHMHGLRVEMLDAERAVAEQRARQRRGIQPFGGDLLERAVEGREVLFVQRATGRHRMSPGVAAG